MFIATERENRVPVHNEFIRSRLAASAFGRRFEYWYATYGNSDARIPSRSFDLPLVVNTTLRPPDLDRLQKTFAAFEYVIGGTSARWFIRATSDTLINFRALGEYLEELEGEWDPDEEIVIRAACLRVYDVSEAYPHGGSGMLFSRRAVEELRGRLPQMLTTGKADDVVWRRFLRRVGLNPRQTTSDRFIGNLGDFALPIKPGYRRGCALPPPRGVCRGFVAPARDVAFWHPPSAQDAGEFSAWIPRIEAFFEADPALHFRLSKREFAVLTCGERSPELIGRHVWEPMRLRRVRALPKQLGRDFKVLPYRPPRTPAPQ